MGELKDMLLKTYLKKGTRPIEAVKEPDDTPKMTPPKPIPVATPKSIGDLTIAMAAQRIFNPSLPPAPASVKSPNNAMMEQGSAPAMDLDNSFLGKK